MSVDIKHVLLSARRRAYLTVAFMDRCGVDIVKKLCEGGVDVKLILSTNVGVDVTKELIKYCAQVRIFGEKFLHAKLYIVDDKAYTGSANMTCNALEGINVEFVSEAPLKESLEEFNKLWERSEVLTTSATEKITTLTGIDLGQTILYIINVGPGLTFKYHKHLRKPIVDNQLCVQGIRPYHYYYSLDMDEEIMRTMYEVYHYTGTKSSEVTHLCMEFEVGGKVGKLIRLSIKPLIDSIITNLDVSKLKPLSDRILSKFKELKFNCEARYSIDGVFAVVDLTAPSITLEPIIHVKWVGDSGCISKAEDVINMLINDMKEELNLITSEIATQLRLVVEKGKEEGWLPVRIPGDLYITLDVRLQRELKRGGDFIRLESHKFKVTNLE